MGACDSQSYPPSLMPYVITITVTQEFFCQPTTDAVCEGDVVVGVGRGEKKMVGQCGINMHHHHNNNTVTSLANSHVTGECIESPVHLHLLLPSCFN